MIVMRVTSRPASVRDPRISNALRQLREAVPMTGEQVALATGWSASKLSRIENAVIAVRFRDLERLLALYQVEEMQRAQLLDTARSTGLIWDPDPSLRASFIRDWSPLVVPEALRTPAYARAVLESFQPVTNAPPSEQAAVLRTIAALQNRLITGTPVLQLHTVIGEAALGHGFGTKDTMRTQIELLIQLAGLPNVNISIARLGLRESPRALGAFSVLSFEPVLGYATPDKALLPGIPRATEVDEERQTWPLRVAFGLLQDAADPDAVNVLKRHYAKWES
jgi:transcriptional regulator with XRE-family HTH domain